MISFFKWAENMQPEFFKALHPSALLTNTTDIYKTKGKCTWLMLTGMWCTINTQSFILCSWKTDTGTAGFCVFFCMKTKHRFLESWVNRLSAGKADPACHTAAGLVKTLTRTTAIWFMSNHVILRMECNVVTRKYIIQNTFVSLSSNYSLFID